MMMVALVLAAVLNIPDIVIREPLPPCGEALRVNRDTPVKLDLSKAKAISFDVTCANLRPYRYFTIYFKCGESYLGHRVEPVRPSGTVEHFEFPIEEFGVDRLKPGESLADVSCVRFSGWRNSAEDALADIVVSNFQMSETPLPKKPPAKLVAAEKIPARSGERRLAWCHRAWGRDKKPGVSWDEQIASLKKAGFTDVLPNLCRAGLAGFKSDVYPSDPKAMAQGDQLEACLAACRRHGLKLHVWKCCWNLGRNPDASYRERLAKAGRLQFRFADVEKGVPSTNWMCPTHPDNVKDETAAMVELAKKGVDGIHFDYIRYPDQETCACPRCRTLFEKRLGRTLANWPSCVVSDRAVAEAWRRFRCDNITAYVKGVAEAVRRECPKVEISAAIRTSAELATYSVAQDWATWAKAGWLDFVCTMGYTSSYTLFRESRLGTVLHEKLPVKVYPGIGVSVWPRRDGLDEVRLREQVLATREAGFGGFCIFEWTPRMEKLLPLFAP